MAKELKPEPQVLTEEARARGIQRIKDDVLTLAENRCAKCNRSEAECGKLAVYKSAFSTGPSVFDKLIPLCDDCRTVISKRKSAELSTKPIDEIEELYLDVEDGFSKI